MSVAPLPGPQPRHGGPPCWRALVYVALGSWFCLPLFSEPLHLGIADWDYFFHQHAAVLKSGLAYGQLPFWNPWACGGNVLWQNPQSALLSPVYALAPVFTLPLAMKINVLLHYLIGLAGMHLLVTRVFEVRFFPLALFLAALFTLAGGEALHLAVGHVGFLAYFYLPLQLFLYLRAVEKRSGRDAAAAGALIALGVYNGGIYIVAMSAVGFGVLASALAVTARSWRPLVTILVVGAAAALLSAPKLLPSILFLRDPAFLDARNPFLPAPLGPALLARSFMDPFVPLGSKFPGQTYAWHEYGNHLGAFGVVLILGSFLWTMTQRGPNRRDALGLSLAVTSLALFLVLVGEIFPAAPAEWLKRLPVFAGLRPPARFTLVFTIFAACLVARVAGRWVERDALATGAARFLGTVLVVATLLLAWQNRSMLAPAFSVPGGPGSAARTFPRTGELSVDRVTNPYAAGSPMYRALVAGRAVWNCYEPLQLRRVADPARPVIYAGADTLLHRTSFTPNRVSFSVTAAAREGRVYLNQNHARGWRSDAGPVRLDPGSGRPFVVIEPDRPGTYSFTFVPPGLWTGVALLLGGLALSLALARRSL